MIEVVKNGFTKIDELSTSDLDDSLNLLAKSFPTSNYLDLRKKIKFFINNDPGLKCLILKQNDECIGIQCIVDRSLKYFGINCLAAGLSFIAINPKYQNSDSIRLIKEYMFNYIKNFDLSFGFARKVMDNYWHPHGYRGVSNFCEIVLPLNSIHIGNIDLVERLVDEKDISSINDYYNKTHEFMLGPLERSPSLWNYYSDKSNPNKKYNIYILIYDRKPIGYYISKKNIIFEVAYDTNYSNKVFKHIISKFKNLNFDRVIYKIGLNHPLYNFINRYEHLVNKKYVWKGGHIAKITSVYKFLIKIKDVLEKRIQSHHIGNFDFQCNNIHFYNKDNNLKISYKEGATKNISFDESEWTKLIFGICRSNQLYGFSADNFENYLNIMFQCNDPMFLEIDHF